MSSTTLDRIKLVALVLLVLGALVTLASCTATPQQLESEVQNAGSGPGGSGSGASGGDTLGLGGQPVGRYEDASHPATQVTGSVGWCTYGAELWFYAYNSLNQPAAEQAKLAAAAATVTGNGNQVATNYAAYFQSSTTTTPSPGALVSWPCVGGCSEGHVAFVASVQTSGSTIVSYTVWEMNYEGDVDVGDGIVDSRTVKWPDADNPVFFPSPTPIDPPAEANQLGTWPSGTQVV
jgi:surface antigen